MLKAHRVADLGADFDELCSYMSEELKCRFTHELLVSKGLILAVLLSTHVATIDQSQDPVVNP